MKNTIPIALAADQNYAVPMGVTMTSIMVNAKEATFVDFFILIPSDFSNQNKNTIYSIKAKYPRCNITFIDMKDSFKYTNLKIPHITYPAYYRLMAGNIIRQYDKCLYLDVDTIVCGDLNELFCIDISDYYVAGVKAPSYHYPDDGNINFCKAIGLPTISEYINSGVLIMNLKQIREQYVLDQFLRLSREKPSLPDQDIINVVCYNRIKVLPFKYNVATMRINEPDYKLRKVFTQEEINEARSNPYIIHYAHQVKPWQDLSLNMSEYWWKYASLAPIYIEALKILLSGNDRKTISNNKPDTINTAMIKKELQDVRKSYSFRIGFLITFIPRTIRDVVYCYRENGIRYTLRRIKERLISIKNKPKIEIKKDYRFYKNLNPKRYPEELKEWYKKNTRINLNLKNPRTYNEKIQWMKLYESTPLKTRLSDKYLVRDWIKENIGEQYLIPLLGVWDKFDDIEFDKLPDSFVLKANHGCGWNVVVKDKNIFDKPTAKNKFDKWMETDYSFLHGFELHYRKIIPKIIAEQYIENDGGDLYDYKVWCFNGKPEFIMFLAERQKHLKMAFYDKSWIPLPFVYSYPRYEKEVPRPNNLDELLQISEKLCKGFNHVRVDFYRLNDGALKFGEMTFTTFSGICKWDPPEYDLKLGQMITLPKKKYTLEK
ncbi:MAG: hypothetical protein JW967_03105 [Dehalococcoidales bacterium]|nr:hypothetical protein [Dehalococcoidales bacterium]